MVGPLEYGNGNTGKRHSQRTKRFNNASKRHTFGRGLNRLKRLCASLFNLGERSPYLGRAIQDDALDNDVICHILGAHCFGVECGELRGDCRADVSKVELFGLEHRRYAKILWLFVGEREQEGRFAALVAVDARETAEF